MRPVFEFVSAKEAIENDAKKGYVWKLPKRGTKKAAGYDFFAPYSFTLKPGESIKVPTFVRAVMPDDYFLMIVPRSGMGFKKFARLANTVGIVDADYSESDNEGHIFVKIRNEGDEDIEVEAGSAFCQGIFMTYNLVEGDSFKTGEDRNGGFGSTDRVPFCR